MPDLSLPPSNHGLNLPGILDSYIARPQPKTNGLAIYHARRALQGRQSHDKAISGHTRRPRTGLRPTTTFTANKPLVDSDSSREQGTSPNASVDPTRPAKRRKIYGGNLSREDLKTTIAVPESLASPVGPSQIPTGEPFGSSKSDRFHDHASEKASTSSDVRENYYPQSAARKSCASKRDSHDLHGSDRRTYFDYDSAIPSRPQSSKSGPRVSAVDPIGNPSPYNHPRAPAVGRANNMEDQAIARRRKSNAYAVVKQILDHTTNALGQHRDKMSDSDHTDIKAKVRGSFMTISCDADLWIGR